MTDFSDIDDATKPGWEGILDPGEEIVWQGRPDPGFNIAGKDIPSGVFALFFSGFALFWMTKAAEHGGAFWMFGMIHFSVGLYLFWKAIFGATSRRRRTWYTLTDRRAFIATDTPFKGRDLKSYPITPDGSISFHDGPLATIHFAQEERRGNKGRRYTVAVGFERIADGKEVIALLRAAQRRQKDTREEQDI